MDMVCAICGWDGELPYRDDRGQAICRSCWHEECKHCRQEYPREELDDGLCWSCRRRERVADIITEIVGAIRQIATEAGWTVSCNRSQSTLSEYLELDLDGGEDEGLADQMTVRVSDHSHTRKWPADIEIVVDDPNDLRWLASTYERLRERLRSRRGTPSE